MANSNKDLVRSANVILSDEETIVVRNGPSSVLKNGALPSMENLVDLKI